MHLAEGTADSAVPSLRRAVELWQEAEAPYEAARARVLLAEALHLFGDAETSALDLQAARSVFHRLGARPDADRAAALASRLARN